MNQNLTLAQLYNEIKQPKRKVFISYHHKDQVWVNEFRELFGDTYDILTDCSLDEAIDSTNLPYIHRTIREDHITGTSITIVICGTDTHKRKCVDWEIQSTLNMNHALLALPLPHNQAINHSGQNVFIVPGRLYNNIASGYAHWIHWTQDAEEIRQAIEDAINKKNANLKNKHNSDPRMLRNRS